MEQKCFNVVRGRRARLTRLDRCGRVETGECVSVVTEGFIEITYTSRITEGEAITVVLANGKNCINDKPPSTWDGWTVNVRFCGVDPLAFEMTTGQDLEYDAQGVPIGFALRDDVDLNGQGVALEVWSDVPADQCDPDDVNAQGAWGYSILPFLQGGVMGDRTITNGAVDFTVQNMETRPGSGWGVGPYDVILDEDGNPGPLLVAVGPRQHEKLFFTSVAPPEPGCSCEASGPPATGVTAGTPSTWTPADSYAPENLAALTLAAPTASPLTAWTTGQYAVLGDDTEVHWDGDSWVEGRA
jgi:hypothetical protein